MIDPITPDVCVAIKLMILCVHKFTDILGLISIACNYLLVIVKTVTDYLANFNEL